jgi:hypothetical protein
MILISTVRSWGILSTVAALICGALLLDGAPAHAAALAAADGQHDSGQATAADPGWSDEDAGSIPWTAVQDPITLIADFRVRRLALIDGRVNASQGHVSPIPARVDTDAAGDYLADGVFRVDTEFAGLYAAVDFQIEMQGEPSGYWVESIVGHTASTGMGFAECAIYLGDPASGGTKVENAPFSCWAKQTENSTAKQRFFFDVEMNRWSEASGTILTVGDVSLFGGVFRSEQEFQVPGSKTVAPDSATSFDAVLREGDTTSFTNQARTEFSYKLQEGSNLPFLWVAGVSANYRGTWFTGMSYCAIYDRDPLTGGRHLDQIPPASNDYGFKCSAVGDFVGGPGESGNGHYHATFTVYKAGTDVEAAGS